MTFIAPRSDLTLEASEKTTPRHPLRTLNEAFRGFRRSVAFLAGLSVVSAVLDAIGINALIPLVSFVTGDGASTDFVSRSLVGVFEFLGVPFSFRYLLAFTVMIFLARAVALAFFTYVRSRTSARFLAREVNALFSAMMRAPWSFVLSRKAATLQNTIFWDARRETQLLDGVIQFVQSSTGALMYLLVAINISAPITVVTLVTGGVLLVASRPLLKRTRSYGNAAATTEKQLAQHVSESIQGFKQAKAAGAGAAIAHIGARSVAQLEHILSRAMFVQNLGAIFIQPL